MAALLLSGSPFLHAQRGKKMQATPVLPDSALPGYPALSMGIDSLQWARIMAGCNDRFVPLSPPDSLCIIGTGDIMLGTWYPSENYLPPGGDCSPLLRPVHHILQSGHLLFGNLEGGLGDYGGVPKHCRDNGNCYVFRMPARFGQCLADAGYDLLSVANNHVNDFGPEGRAITAGILDSLGFAFAGFLERPYTVLEKDGLRYGFAAFAPNRGCMDMLNYRAAADIARHLDSISDVVIISFHGGAEGRNHQHVVKGDEVFLGYNRGSVYRFAHAVVDAGADIVFGHGPHVSRAIELYRDRIICYSLGNFATYGRFNLSGPNGIAPILKLMVSPSGRFLKGQIVPICQSGEGGPRPDPYKRATEKIRTLSTSDFPMQELEIGSDGSLRRKESRHLSP